MKEKEMFLRPDVGGLEELTEVNLSQLSDQKEAEWRLEANTRISPLIEFLSNEMRQDLHDTCKARDDLELFQKLKFWLFGVHKDLLYEGLEKFGLSTEKFEQEMIVSTILSTTTERDNLDFILEVMIRNEVVNDLKVEGKNFILEMENGVISFSKANEYFDYQNETIEMLLKKEDLKGGCHEVSEELLKSDPEYKIMTTICRKDLVENYYHSVVLMPENKVVDLTENLVIGEKDFCKLYDVQEKVVFGFKEYEKLQEESGKYDRQDGNGLVVPLRIAVNEWRKDGRI